MDEMKTALERAMERADQLGEASEEDRRRWKYHPEGEKLAAMHLKDECDLVSEIGKYEDQARAYVLEAALEILLRSIDLPKNEATKRTTRKAMEAIKELKRDKVAVENAYTKLRRVFNHYEQEGEQQRRQVYEELKADVEAKLRQVAQQQGYPAQARINVESQPQFQQEWRRAQAQLDAQYLKLLDEYKQEIAAIP
jgi:dsDNA-specific endonuclease/ATPase MutS2